MFNGKYIMWLCGCGVGETGGGGGNVKRWKGRWRWHHKDIVFLKDIYIVYWTGFLIKPNNKMYIY